MPKIKNSKKKTKSKTKNSKSTALKAIPKQNAWDYYQCMECSYRGKKITQTAHECKTNALAINAKFSATKKKAIKKVSDAYKQMGVGLKEFIKAK